MEMARPLPIPLRTRVRIPQSVRDKHEPGTGGRARVCAAAALQVPVSCISVTARGTCIISAVNALTSQALMVNEHRVQCF